MEVRDEEMISWDLLPLDGNFKVPKPGGRGNTHPAKPPEKVKQQCGYMKYMQLAKSVGITEPEFRAYLVLPRAVRCMPRRLLSRQLT